MSKSNKVFEYDPARDRGPLRCINGNYYWNWKYTSEFMLEADLDLADCIDFGFVNHHSTYCNLKDECREKGSLAVSAAGRILSVILAQEIRSVDNLLTKAPAWKPQALLSHVIDQGASGIYDALARKRNSFRGDIVDEDEQRNILVGALSLYGYDKKEDARRLVALFPNTEAFTQALGSLINAHFGIRGWRLPE